MSGPGGGVGGSGGTGGSTGSGGRGSSTSSGSQSSGSSGAGQSGTGAAGGWQKATPSAGPQYMPNVLGCACHGVRAAGAAPPPNNAALNAGAAGGQGQQRQQKWVPGVIPFNDLPADGTLDQGKAVTNPPVWTPGLIDALRPKGPAEIGKRPGSRPPDATSEPSMDQFLDGLKNTANNALAGHKAKFPGFMTPEDKETRSMLEALAARLSTPEGTASLKAAMEEASSDPMYKFMGPDKFAASLAWSDALLAKSAASSDPDLAKRANDAMNSGLTVVERVALFGYTTGDYKIINGPMRKGGPYPPGLTEYIQHINDAMAKLPDYQGPKLERGVGGGAWTDEAFVAGKDFTDAAFVSTTPGKAAGAQWTIVIQGEQHGKDIGIFSAWPAENEVLVPPGTKYEIVSVDKTSNPPTVVMRPKP